MLLELFNKFQLPLNLSHPINSLRIAIVDLLFMKWVEGDDEKKVTEEPGTKGGDLSKDGKSYDQEKEDNVNSNNTVNAASINEVNAVGAKTSIELPNDPNMPELEDIVYSDDDEDVGAEADINNLDAYMPVNFFPTTRIHKDHTVEQIIRDLNSAPQTRRMTKNLEEHGSKLDRATQEEASTIQDTRRLDFGKIADEVYVCHHQNLKIQTSRTEYNKGEKHFMDSSIKLLELDQVYVDDIIFGSTKKSLCTEFEKMMHTKFQMSSLGELTTS
ncbi:hypothetical protein Tco_0322742 [Tanacetum coccineum]